MLNSSPSQCTPRSEELRGVLGCSFSLVEGTGRQQLYLLAQQIPLQGLWPERVRVLQIVIGTLC